MKSNFRPLEKDLHRIWSYGWFPSVFNDTDGNAVQIINKGRWNHYDGPDFLEAHILVNDVHWYGAIEFHIKASDYLKHNHQVDENYNNVILHLVWENDLCLNQLEFAPSFTAVVQFLIPDKWLRLQLSKIKIPCKNTLSLVFNDHWGVFKYKLLAERWEAKQLTIGKSQFSSDQEKQLLMMLGKYFLSPKDISTWEYWVSRVNVTFIKQYRNDAKKLKCYLFLSAGIHKDVFLHSYEGYFVQQKLGDLNFEFNWSNYTRPASHIFKLLGLIYDLYTHYDGPLSALHHFQTNKFKNPDTLYMGKEKWSTLVINVWLPFLLQKKTLDEGLEKWIHYLSGLPFEKNKITKSFIPFFTSKKYAVDSQAIIQLFNAYCISKKCLYCNLGVACLNA